MVERSIYLSHTRPNIVFILLVRFYNILRKFQEKEFCLKRNESATFKEYIDVDYKGMTTNQRFTTRYCIFLRRNLLIWRSEKQNGVAQSSAEVEYRSMTQNICINKGRWSGRRLGEDGPDK